MTNIERKVFPSSVARGMRTTKPCVLWGVLNDGGTEVLWFKTRKAAKAYDRGEDRIFWDTKLDHSKLVG